MFAVLLGATTLAAAPVSAQARAPGVDADARHVSEVSHSANAIERDRSHARPVLLAASEPAPGYITINPAPPANVPSANVPPAVPSSAAPQSPPPTGAGTPQTVPSGAPVPAPAPPSSAPASRTPSPDTGDAAVPVLQQRVTDRTNTLDAAAREALTAQLAALEARKGAQVAVLIVPTTQPESIEQYATRAFEQWKLGRKNTDDGVLLLVAKDDRTLRIEVGYGLEGAIPDSRASQIINEQIVPRFASGDFAGGIAAGVKSIAALVDGEPLPPPTSASRDTSNDISLNLPTLMTSLIVGVIMVLVLPAMVGVLAVGAAAYTATGMLWVAGLAVVLASVLSLVLHALGIKGGGKGGGGKGGGKGGGGGGSGRRAGAILGGLGGLRGGSMGGGRSSGGGFGGGFGGGGGRSGGGGASGRW